MSRSVTEQCMSEGSIQKLVINKWKTVGIGQLILFTNPYNPTHVLIKLIRKKRNKVHIFQCKPKTKTNSKALIIKGTDTKTNQEYVLAIKFTQDNGMQQFQTCLDKSYRTTKYAPTSARDMEQSQEEISQELNSSVKSTQVV